MRHDEHLTCEQLIDALDDYLDGRLPTAASAEAGGGIIARSAVDAHLATCAHCPALVADVRAIRKSARMLEPVQPPAHVWSRIREQLGAPAPPRTTLRDRLVLSGGWLGVLQPLGAAAVLVLMVSSLVWVGLQLSNRPAAVQVADGAGALAGFQIAEAEYTVAIERLEEAADTAAPRLDALTSVTLQSSIDDIDLAIGDAREALAREPGDLLSQESLLDALGSKVALLQDTVALLGNLEPATEEQTP